MAEAFQQDAFQTDAFQELVASIAGFAFQECAFEDTSFQADVCTEVPDQQLSPINWMRRRHRR